jgi:hypothetical protein
MDVPRINIDMDFTYCITFEVFMALKIADLMYSLMFVSCIIRHSSDNQQYALICTTPLFYILAPTVLAVACHHQGAS